MARGGPGAQPARGPDPTYGRLFLRFAITGLAAVIVVGVIVFVDVRRSASSSVLRQAKQLTELAGRGIAAPFITRDVLTGKPAALARFDRLVRSRILHGEPFVRVKIWDEHGRIVYSDDTRLIGSTYDLGADELRVLRNGGVEADASDLRRPENRFDRRFKRLVEVYVGIRAANGSRLLYEDYERSSTLSASSRSEWISLVPALIGALLVLYLVQLPLAYSLGRRARGHQRERADLLRRAIDASDLERRRIAADLHDSAVQRLAGISLSLAASVGGNGARDGAAHGMQSVVAAAAVETRETIRELRTLLVDIYPPTLQRSGLLAALDDLVAPLRTAGTEVTLSVPDLLDLPDDIEALFYRVAQEAVRNIRQHGAASEVGICAEVANRQAILTVFDNGRGFSVADGVPQGTGHFGLRLMHDLVDHAGGRLDLTSAPGEGTSIRVSLPVR